MTRGVHSFPSDEEMSFVGNVRLYQAYKRGISEGIVLGEKRLARAFTRLIDKLIGDHLIEDREAHDKLYGFLTSRAKRRKT